MASIIETLFEIKLQEEKNYSAEERKLLTAESDAYDELLKELTAQQKDLLKLYINLRERAFYEELMQYFSDGFKMGMRITLECVPDKI